MYHELISVDCNLILLLLVFKNLCELKYSSGDSLSSNKITTIDGFSGNERELLEIFISSYSNDPQAMYMLKNLVDRNEERSKSFYSRQRTNLHRELLRLKNDDSGSKIAIMKLGYVLFKLSGKEPNKNNCSTDITKLYFT